MEFPIHSTVTINHLLIRMNFQPLQQSMSLNKWPVYRSIRRATTKSKMQQRSPRIWWRKLPVPTQILACPTGLAKYSNWRYQEFTRTANVLQARQNPAANFKRTPGTPASQRRKEAQTRYFNRDAKELPSLTEGDVLRMKLQASDGKNRWTKAQVEQQLDVSCHAFRTRCQVVRRNRRHLRQSREPFVCKDADVEIPSLILNHRVQDTEQSASKQTQDHKPPSQRHQLNVTKQCSYS